MEDIIKSKKKRHAQALDVLAAFKTSFLVPPFDSEAELAVQVNCGRVTRKDRQLNTLDAARAF
jgi:hypothetical protein